MKEPRIPRLFCFVEGNNGPSNIVGQKATMIDCPRWRRVGWLSGDRHCRRWATRLRRTLPIAVRMSAFDPKRTLPNRRVAAHNRPRSRPVEIE